MAGADHLQQHHFPKALFFPRKPTSFHVYRIDDDAAHSQLSIDHVLHFFSSSLDVNWPELSSWLEHLLLPLMEVWICSAPLILSSSSLFGHFWRWVPVLHCCPLLLTPFNSLLAAHLPWHFSASYSFRHHLTPHTVTFFVRSRSRSFAPCHLTHATTTTVALQSLH